MATPSRSFLCLRHGITDWNRQGRFQGRTDVPLNNEGLAQARAAAERMHMLPFDHVVTSPLIRAQKTAEIIAAAAGKPLEIDDGIIECDFGNLEGMSIAATMKARGLKTVEGLVSILPPDWRTMAVDICPLAELCRPVAEPSSVSHDLVRLPRCGDAIDVGSALWQVDRQPPQHAVQV